MPDMANESFTVDKETTQMFIEHKIQNVVVTSEQNSFQDLDPKTVRKELVSSILSELREVVREAVNSVMERRLNSEDYTEMSEEALIVSVNFEIESGVLMRIINEQIEKHFGSPEIPNYILTLDDIFEDLLPGIRRIILLEISLWKVENLSPIQVV